MENKVKNKKSKGSRIFVGNVPYELNQADLEEIFSCVGPIVGPFNLIKKKEETKHSGYGFCRYSDCETAQAAIRNLNGYEIKGRLLKVSYANEDSTEEKYEDESFSDPMHFELQNQGKSLIDIVQSLPLKQKYFVLLQLKKIKDQNPELFSSLIHSNPFFTEMIYNIQKELESDYERPFMRKYKEDFSVSASHIDDNIIPEDKAYYNQLGNDQGLIHSKNIDPRHIYRGPYQQSSYGHKDQILNQSTIGGNTDVPFSGNIHARGAINYHSRGEAEQGYRPNTNLNSSQRNFLGGTHGPHGNFSSGMKNPALSHHMPNPRGGYFGVKKHNYHSHSNKAKLFGHHSSLNAPREVANQPAHQNFYKNNQFVDSLDMNMMGAETIKMRNIKGGKIEEGYYNPSDLYYDNSGFRNQEDQ